jgi:hypothetical protein
MQYDEGFAALNSGDFKTAVNQLEQAALDTNYVSDIINHAYTLALYRAGETQRLAEVAFRVGNLLVESDPGSAMDYFQRALIAGLDPARVRVIGQVHEEWAVPASNSLPSPPITRVAHVVDLLRPDNGMLRYIQMLTASLKRRGVESTVFTTEDTASWFFNPKPFAPFQSVEVDAETVIAAVEGDFIERAERVAAAIRASEVQVAFFHGNLNNQIMARVAAFRPAPIQINVNHCGEMAADLFNGYVHLTWSALEETMFESHHAEWIPLASDAEERLQASRPIARQTLGFESASCVSATFGSLSKSSGKGYLRIVSELLRRSPKHFHLFVGGGDVKAIRGYLHSEGVLTRVRFLGDMLDVAPVLESVDVYLDSFPTSNNAGVLDAMAAGKPVVTMKQTGGELVAAEDLTAANESEYFEIAERLVHTPSLRATLGQTMKERFQAEFRPSRLGERYVAFLNRLLESR